MYGKVTKDITQSSHIIIIPSLFLMLSVAIISKEILLPHNPHGGGLNGISVSLSDSVIVDQPLSTAILYRSE